jgi:hypothetical protein
MTDDELLAAFESATPPSGGLPHREHVRVAWVYLRRYGLRVALDRVSMGLRRLAAAAGKESRYHETVTWAYVMLVHERMLGEDADSSWDRFAARHPDLLDWTNSILTRYYTPARLASDAARTSFLWPDRYPGSENPPSEGSFP